MIIQAWITAVLLLVSGLVDRRMVPTHRPRLTSQRNLPSASHTPAMTDSASSSPTSPAKSWPSQVNCRWQRTKKRVCSR